jgi:hypothetical protein
MSTHELNPLPLDKILKEVQELIKQGYNPLHYLAQFKIGDEGGYLRKE